MKVSIEEGEAVANIWLFLDQSFRQDVKRENKGCFYSESPRLQASVFIANDLLFNPKTFR